jgi:hypothetical protein
MNFKTLLSSLMVRHEGLNIWTDGNFDFDMEHGATAFALLSSASTGLLDRVTEIIYIFV